LRAGAIQASALFFTGRENVPETAHSEFWKGIKPVEKVFREGGLPEVYLSKIAEGDERYWVPISETVSSKPVWISPSKNMWADVLMSKSAGLVNRHYHPHPIWAYTISGKWAYLEHEWTATAGDFVYETPGESHTLVCYEHEDPMKVFFVVSGPLMWLDEEGNTTGHFDVFDYIKNAREHYDRVGIGADYVDTLIR
jgi:2,4'-dihydroxyacetophenone dioxygenase